MLKRCLKKWRRGEAAVDCERGCESFEKPLEKILYVLYKVYNLLFFTTVKIL